MHWQPKRWAQVVALSASLPIPPTSSPPSSPRADTHTFRPSPTPRRCIERRLSLKPTKQPWIFDGRNREMEPMEKI